MKIAQRFLIVTLVLMLCAITGCEQKKETPAVEEKATTDLKPESIPQVVMDGLKAKFASAEIDKWEREMEGEVMIYDFEFTQDGQKFEADIKEDGSILNWEKAIDVTDLPEAARMAAEAKYPGAAFKEVMEIMAVTEGMDALEGYEIVLETADMKYAEIMVTAEGEILEDSGEGKPEEE